MLKPLLFFQIIIFFFSAAKAELAQLNCESKHLVEIKNPSDRQFNPASLKISPSGKILSYASTGRGLLKYSVVTGEGSWRIGNKTYPISMDEAGPYYIDEASLKNSRTKPVRARVSADEGRVFSALRKMPMKTLRDKVKACREVKSFRDQLKLPLEPIEVKTCKRNLEQLHKVQFCEKNKNCKQAYKELFYSPDGPQTSFVKLFESNFSLSDKQKRIGVLMVADSAVGYAAGAYLVFNKKKVAKFAARIGLRFNQIMSVYFAVSSLSKPVILAIMGPDSCGTEELTKSTNKTLKECIGKSARQLQTIFQKDLEKALESPEKFMKKIAQAKDGRIGRFACYAFETMINKKKEEYLGYSQFQCRGRAINMRNGKEYLIADDGHLYRHRMFSQNYHFYNDGNLKIEDTSKKTLTDAVFMNDAADYLTEPNLSPDEKAQREYNVKQSNLPETVRDELRMLEVIRPLVSSSVGEGMCREPSPSQESFSDQ